MVAFALFQAAYYAEIIRAGIQAVPSGQLAAALALGMSRGKAMRLVVLPQAFRKMIPLLLTQSVILFQDTSLVYVSALADFFGAAYKVGDRDGRLVELLALRGRGLPRREPRRLAARAALAGAARHVISIRNVTKSYGAFRALEDCSAEVAKGEVVVVCGPSGSGKSTLVKCVNGLERFERGEIVVNGVSVGDPRTDLPRLRAHVGMVFQHFELFPHMTVLENLCLAQVKVLGRGRGGGGGAEPRAPRPGGPPLPGGEAPGPALRRPAAARGHRAGARHGPDLHALRRAHLRPRPRDDQRGAGRHGRPRAGRA